LPGRNPTEAREAFLVPLRKSLSCITDAVLYVPNKQTGELEALTLSDDPLKLRRGAPPSDNFVQLSIGHQFKVVHDDDGWHVSTAQYAYDLLDSDGKQLIAWHWHPGTGMSIPHLHLHVPTGPINHKMHLPTGRVSIEAVIRLLIDEFEVLPVRDDYEDILREAEAKFVQYRRWP
jgi:hypothetical protein